MKFEISIDTIKRTTKCHANFSCLNDAENPKSNDRLAICPVEDYIAHDMVFVDFQDNSFCNYNMLYGTKNRICHCPVRNEIYKRYNM